MKHDGFVLRIFSELHPNEEFPCYLSISISGMHKNNPRNSNVVFNVLLLQKTFYFHMSVPLYRASIKSIGIVRMNGKMCCLLLQQSDKWAAKHQLAAS